MHETSDETLMLAVDLDGTLLCSDMLHETFWNVASKDWSSAITAVRALRDGKAALKHQLAQASDVDVTTLPYDGDVLDYISDWKEKGGKVALVTAANHEIASKIAAHLGVFDAVHGSTERLNLKGPNKAEFLTETYGADGFAYMGDTDADLPVWSAAQKIITVKAPRNLRDKAEAMDKDTVHLGSVKVDYTPYIKALRPHQWVKNILIFVPILLAQHLDLTTLFMGLLGFIAFSLVASSVYVINDLLDLDADRAHPRKCKRPFAAGTVPIQHGTAIAAVLLGLGTAVSLCVGPVFLLTLVFYFAATIGYSLYFKRRIIIDICVLAGLYTMRIIAGGVVANVMISVWLLAFSIFFFFALAAIKRQAELVDNAKTGKLAPSGRGYRVTDLPVVSQMSIASAYVSVLILALYINSPTVTSLYANPPALWGICLVLLFWVSWISITTHRGEMHDDPIVFAVKDRISRICGCFVIVFGLLGTIAL
ncbi:UbiA family prenyltransferase [Pacificibacter marinus]|uniref:Decaprenyl-phosphate phosphoribosyltransferase n=1 Tax=Pacificibacter marinus TaxID=658057 RepID=A0A1Y5RCB6_9RHOB|nr:UbiA family prenyltransferase [Pacificibacter marinus]SEK24021.1 4-hydroxybenzoate polyprenyltransferase [Pacificibacter marinus]SLN14079.1 Decaprenyl-phosphate phosphoribosyltransferase [Pacificibacter marinus]